MTSFMHAIAAMVADGFTPTIAAGVAMALILWAIAYFRGNVPGGLAAVYCLLLTAGCVVIFYRNEPLAGTASIELQATISRQQVRDMSGQRCATLMQGKITPLPVRRVVCPPGAAAECTATLDVPSDQAGALLAASQTLSITALAACQ